jgi:putative PIN family toxin of toxin-antitoxin system
MVTSPSHSLLITPDTNVIVSGTTIATTPPGQIIRAWREEAVNFALCESILTEVADVLSRPYFAARVGWTHQHVQEYVQELRDGSTIVPGTTPVHVCKDPDDNAVFACAYEAGADYVVSGDEKHVVPVGSFQGIPVVRPRVFVRLLTRREQKQAAQLLAKGARWGSPKGDSAKVKVLPVWRMQ